MVPSHRPWSAGGRRPPARGRPRRRRAHAGSPDSRRPARRPVPGSPATSRRSPSDRSTSPRNPQQLRQVPCLRAAHANRRALPAPRQISERRVRSKPAVVDDDHLVHGLRHLGQDMAGDQDRPALRRHRSQEIPQPPDPLRIEPVRGLVEDQDLGVAEERRGKVESLLHAERIGLDAPCAHAFELDQPEHLLHSGRRQPGSRAITRRWLRPRRPGWKPEVSTTAPTVPIGAGRERYGRPSMVAVPDVAFASPSRMRRVVVFPAPFGPRKPRIEPRRTVKLSPSTATALP